MEDKEKNLPKEEANIIPENADELTPKLEEDKGIGIEPEGNGLDEESAEQTKLLSNIKLSTEQKNEVKLLLQDELKTSVQALKDEVKNEGQEIKKDFLTIFGLFASFVTFLSIEVQVFKNKDNVLELIGISSITLSFVMFFALIINDIAKDKNTWRDFLKPTYIFNLFFAIVGVIFLYIGGTSSINRMDSFEQKIKIDSVLIRNQKNEIDSLQKKINSIEKAFEQSKAEKQMPAANLQPNEN